jgi:hypothetical protein
MMMMMMRRGRKDKGTHNDKKMNVLLMLILNFCFSLDVDNFKIRIVKIRRKKRLSKMSNTKMFVSSTKNE